MRASDERMGDRAMVALRSSLNTCVGLVLALIASASGGAIAQTSDGAWAGNGACGQRDGRSTLGEATSSGTVAGNRMSLTFALPLQRQSWNLEGIIDFGTQRVRLKSADRAAPTLAGRIRGSRIELESVGDERCRLVLMRTTALPVEARTAPATVNPLEQVPAALPASLPSAPTGSDLSRNVQREAFLERGSSEIAAVQRALQILGFYGESADGAYGPATERGIMAWLQSQGLGSAGYLTAEQSDRLKNQALARMHKGQQRDGSTMRPSGKLQSDPPMAPIPQSRPRGEGQISPTPSRQSAEVQSTAGSHRLVISGKWLGPWQVALDGIPLRFKQSFEGHAFVKLIHSSVVDTHRSVFVLAYGTGGSMCAQAYIVILASADSNEVTPSFGNCSSVFSVSSDPRTSWRFENPSWKSSVPGYIASLESDKIIVREHLSVGSATACYRVSDVISGTYSIRGYPGRIRITPDIPQYIVVSALVLNLDAPACFVVRNRRGSAERIPDVGQVELRLSEVDQRRLGQPEGQRINIRLDDLTISDGERHGIGAAVRATLIRVR